MNNPYEENTGTTSVSVRPSACILRSISLIALILSMLVVDAPTFGAQAAREGAPYSQQDRVISLIVQLADQAHLSQDMEFAVRSQAQAGSLVWPYDRDQARKIFRRAFGRLLPSTSDSRPDSELERTRKQQLRVDLLNQLASCDQEMADLLAREFALSNKATVVGRASFASYGAPAFIAARGPVDAEGRELLVSVALRVAGVDRARAMRLGQLSLEAGISPYFDRLLLLIGETDSALADRLFSNAVYYLERSEPISLSDVHTISFYLVSSVGRSDKDHQTRGVIKRFLNLAFDVVMRDCSVSQAAASLVATDQSFDLYCTGKYLMELLPRYLPDRAARLQSRLSQFGDREPSGSATGISAAQVIQPSAIEQAACVSADARERDFLYARAAFGWLARGELFEAQRTASNIANAEVRDRVLLPVALRLMSKALFKDAMLIVRVLQDSVAKTDLLVRLAQGVFSLRNMRCARTLLDLAELEATKIERPFAHAQSLLAIVAGFSAFDQARAFGVMQEAVKSINDIPARLNSERTAPFEADTQTEELFQLIYASSLTTLARLDFERTLLLSQQLTCKEFALIAQLAVCRGGLRPVASSRGERNEN